MGITTGYVFETEGNKKARLKDFEPEFISYLTWVQKYKKGVIPLEVDVEEDYGASRLGQRGGTTLALNMGVDWDDINLQMLWKCSELNVG